MGGNNFTLLPSFGTAANTRTLSAAQLGQFQTETIHNDRDNTSVTGSVVLNQQWSIKVDYNHLDQSGAKLMAFGGAKLLSGPGAAVTGETPAILPMPTAYKTDTVNAALNWLGDKAYASLSYYGSYFRDKYNGVNFTTFAGAQVNETMGTPPSNDLHQFNLTGGYAFSKRTKLAGGLSYSRNTQNTAYAYDTAAMVTPSPTSSLNGLVVNTHADVKLTDQTTKNLALSAGFKYDNRDNRTSSNIYNLAAISGGNIANYPNAPYNFKKTQLELAGDYRIDTKQKVRLAYNHDDIHRKCDNYASGGGAPLTPYAPGTNCVTVTDTREDKLGATWRYKAAEAVNLNAGYTFANRRSTRDENARPPMIGLDGNTVVAPAAPGLVAPGITGINGGEFRGFNPFFEASRKQNAFKLGANWDLNDKWSLGANGRYTDDKYGTTFGMQKGHQWSLNLDSTYAYREDGTFSAYATQQERTRDMTNEQRSPTTQAAGQPAGIAGAPSATAVAIPAGGTWNNSLKDTDTTVGLALKQGGLMGGRLELAGDFSYSWTKTSYSTVLNYSTTTTGGLTCTDPTVFTCVPLPDITSRLVALKLNGTYAVTKTSKVRLGWVHQKLSASDYYYNGVQAGFTPTSVLPTNQVAPNYTVNVLYGSMIITF